MPADEISYDNLNIANSSKVAVKLIIEGKVQKVGLRHWIKQEAELFQILGWVRNKTNGSVEAFFWGTEDNVNEMVKQCYQGPSFAKVTEIKQFPQIQINNVPVAFMILPTV